MPVTHRQIVRRSYNILEGARLNVDNTIATGRDIICRNLDRPGGDTMNEAISLVALMVMFAIAMKAR